MARDELYQMIKSGQMYLIPRDKGERDEGTLPLEPSEAINKSNSGKRWNPVFEQLVKKICQ